MFIRSIKIFAGDLGRSFFDLTIVIGVVAFFQFVILRTVPDEWPMMLVGLVVVWVGLALFMRGLHVGIFPLGEGLAHHLSRASSRAILIVFAFVIGFATTIAEPALIAVADKAAEISAGAIDAFAIRAVVAFSVGTAIVLGVIRLLIGHPIHYYIIGGYIIATTLAFFSPPEIVALAFDSGGITTSTVTVPLIAALGIGLASSLKNRNPVIDGFGLIALASVTPMIFVQLYGMAVYTFPPSPSLNEIGFAIPAASSALGAVFASGAYDIIMGFLKTVRDVAPVAVVILFFYYVVLRTPIEHIATRTFGFVMVLIGLYAFVYGLEAGLFPIGESIARTLAEAGNVWITYLFAFTIGFATTMAEPALTTIARKAEEISGGSVRQLILRLFVATGAGFGIFLGAYRIVNGDPIIWYLVIGYGVVILLTLFAPRTMIPIAYDSGGVTTSTITVPIVAAIGIGLATAIPGRDPLIDGFGMIALTVLFPIVSVLAYSIFERESIRRYERHLASLSQNTVSRILKRLQKEDTPTVGKYKKEIITITGISGSGASTAAQKIAERLGYHYFSSGALFQAVADAHNLSVVQLAKEAETNPVIDREIDELIQELGIKHTKLVVDSRLAYHWIHRSFKVYLTARPETIAHRRGAHGAHLEHEDAARYESKKRRAQALYGLDITNLQPFDLVIETDPLTQDEVVETIIRAYQDWIKNKK